jgi:hypothetical protein
MDDEHALPKLHRRAQQTRYEGGQDGRSEGRGLEGQDLADVSTNRSDKPGPNDEGWFKLFQTIYQDLQEKAHLDKLRNNRPSARRALSMQPNQPTTSSGSTDSDAGDPMVLDVQRGPRHSREQCAQQGLCFYCKQPGHSKDNHMEKRTRLTVLMLGF